MCYSFISAYANLPNSSRHFLKYKSVFLQNYIIYFGQRNQLKSKIFRFSSARVKIHQIPHVMSFFIVMKHNSSVNFKLIHFLLWKKNPIKVPILTLSSALVKIYQIPVILPTTSQFFFKFCITFLCYER